MHQVFGQAQMEREMQIEIRTVMQSIVQSFYSLDIQTLFLVHCLQVESRRNTLNGHNQASPTQKGAKKRSARGCRSGRKVREKGLSKPDRDRKVGSVVSPLRGLDPDRTGKVVTVGQRLFSRMQRSNIVPDDGRVQSQDNLVLAKSDSEDEADERQVGSFPALSDHSRHSSMDVACSDSLTAAAACELDAEGLSLFNGLSDVDHFMFLPALYPPGFLNDSAIVQANSINDSEMVGGSGTLYNIRRPLMTEVCYLLLHAHTQDT
jgi:hypothetical protein